jgi:hypothetical protein
MENEGEGTYQRLQRERACEQCSYCESDWMRVTRGVLFGESCEVERVWSQRGTMSVGMLVRRKKVGEGASVGERDLRASWHGDTQ